MKLYLHICLDSIFWSCYINLYWMINKGNRNSNVAYVFAGPHIPRRLRNGERHKVHNVVTSSGVHKNSFPFFSSTFPLLSLTLPFLETDALLSPFHHSSHHHWTALPSLPFGLLPWRRLRSSPLARPRGNARKIEPPRRPPQPPLPRPLRPPPLFLSPCGLLPWLPQIHAAVAVEEDPVVRATSSLAAWPDGADQADDAPPLTASGTIAPSSPLRFPRSAPLLLSPLRRGSKQVGGVGKRGPRRGHLRWGQTRRHFTTSAPLSGFSLQSDTFVSPILSLSLSPRADDHFFWSRTAARVGGSSDQLWSREAGEGAVPTPLSPTRKQFVYVNQHCHTLRMCPVNDLTRSTSTRGLFLFGSLPSLL